MVTLNQWRNDPILGIAFELWLLVHEEEIRRKAELGCPGDANQRLVRVVEHFWEEADKRIYIRQAEKLCELLGRLFLKDDEEDDEVCSPPDLIGQVGFLSSSEKPSGIHRFPIFATKLKTDFD